MPDNENADKLAKKVVIEPSKSSEHYCGPKKATSKHIRKDKKKYSFVDLDKQKSY